MTKAILNGKAARSKAAKTKLDSLSAQSLRMRLTKMGWTPTLDDNSYQSIIDIGFRGKNLPFAAVAAQIALHEHPITLRGLMYRIVSAGWLPSTDREHYTRVGRVMTTMREAGVVPFSWIVDNVRSTEKPSSWSGLGDFLETVQGAYRKDFWSHLPDYVHVIVEKDAIAGTLAPVTRQYDVRLSPLRGYVSLSFAHEIASTWNAIAKPIHVYYLGDFDASGFDLERDVRAKLTRYCTRPFAWHRLGVTAQDFSAFDLIPLKPKKSDTRFNRFVAAHGTKCAELDALPPTELRQRVENAITNHIPDDQWQALQDVERIERESFGNVLERLRKANVA